MMSTHSVKYVYVYHDLIGSVTRSGFATSLNPTNLMVKVKFVGNDLNPTSFIRVSTKGFSFSNLCFEIGNESV